MHEPRAKRHRLDPALYAGQCVVFTANINARRKYFVSHARFARIEHALIDGFEKFDCVVDLYVMMPDHLHVMVSADSPSANPLYGMYRFKQRSAMLLKEDDFHWQASFHDHITKSDADRREQLKYILYNPVVAELCERWQDYPYLGSRVFDLQKWR